MKKLLTLIVFSIILLIPAGIQEALAQSFIPLGDLPGGFVSSVARGVSSDGAVVVGVSVSGSGLEAFRWTSGGGMVGLGDLAGGSFFSESNGISSDGAVVVGRGDSASGTEAFRWTSGGGMVGLGDLAGGIFFSQASGASSDGSVVVGQSISGSGTEAFVWDSVNGIQSLNTVLANLGVDLTGYTLANADEVSSDGTIIVGVAEGPSGAEAYLADISTGSVVIGGKLLPIDTTALLLAGAQSFSWMIPVTLSVLGIGLFVVSRKSE